MSDRLKTRGPASGMRIQKNNSLKNQKRATSPATLGGDELFAVCHPHRLHSLIGDLGVDLFGTQAGVAFEDILAGDSYCQIGGRCNDDPHPNAS
jgi:hypothetical protein